MDGESKAEAARERESGATTRQERRTELRAAFTSAASSATSRAWETASHYCVSVKAQKTTIGGTTRWTIQGVMKNAQPRHMPKALSMRRIQVLRSFIDRTANVSCRSFYYSHGRFVSDSYLSASSNLMRRRGSYSAIYRRVLRTFRPRVPNKMLPSLPPGAFKTPNTLLSRLYIQTPQVPSYEHVLALECLQPASHLCQHLLRIHLLFLGRLHLG